MIVYTGENEIKLVQSIASASTLISSLTGEIKEYIVSKFPRGFFKSVYIDTAETIQAQNRNEQYNKTLNKLPYPNMAISPNISLDDPIGGMEKSQHLSSPNLYLRREMRKNYKKLIVDPNNKFSVYFTSDYITLNFGFRITVNKFVQNMDLAYYIKSRFQIGMFQYLNDKYLNTEIPKTFIKIIAEILGLDINNTDEMEELRLYLISTGTQEDMILKRVNALTGKDCFFVNEKNNFLTLVTDLDAPSAVIRDNMNEGEYGINFRVQVSSWLPNSFIMSLNVDKFNQLDPSISQEALSNTVMEQEEGFYSLSIPNLTVNRKEAIYFETSTGEQVIGQEVFHNVFTYNLNNPLIRINLWDYLKDDLKKVHAYMMSKNFDIKDLLSIKVQNRGGILNNTQVDIDYENMSITILEEMDQDIAITVYVNRALFETIIKAIGSDSFFFTDNALAIVRISYRTLDTDNNGIIDDSDELQEFYVPVYTFSNEKEMYGKASYVNGEIRTNTLRINTAYGIGFVGLVDENDPRASQYKLCVGYEKDVPIIKAFETIEL
jgi:hypothetical protein